MQKRDDEEELEKCKTDIVYFVEKYMVIGGKPMVLREFEKEFLREHHERMNNEQLKFVLTGLRMGNMFRHKSQTNLSKFLKDFPVKKTNQVFEWNLQGEEPKTK